MLVEDSYKADADADAELDGDADTDADADVDCLGESSTSTLLEMMVLDDGHLIDSNQCLYLPKVELKTKNSTKRVWLSFWFSTQFTRKKRVHSRGIYL